MLILVFAAAAVVIMHAGRNTTFFFDDWNFVDDRIGWRPHVLLYPHNEHLSLLPVLVYKILFETVGLDNYGVFRAVSVGFNLTCGALLFVYVRRRLGPWPALGFATCLVVMGAGAWDIVWPFQIGFLGSLAATLGALLMLDLQTRRGDIAACVLICVSLSSSSQGLMLLAAVVVEVLWRSDRVRRLWIPAIPAVLYGLWYLKYGGSHTDFGKGIPLIPDRIYGGLDAGTTAATGLPSGWGGALALGLIGAFLYSLPRAETRLPRLLLVAAMPLAFWVLIALARSDLPPSESRYLYPTGIYIVLLASESLLVFAPRGVAAIGIAILLGMGALARAPVLNETGDVFRTQSLHVLSGLTAAELLHGQVDPSTRPDPAQPQLSLDRYEKAVAAYGSSAAWSPGQIPGRSDSERAAVDAALIRLINPQAESPPSAPRAGCASLSGEGTATFEGRLYVKAGAQTAEVRLRRFGRGLTNEPQMTVPARTARVLVVPHDRSPKQWTAVVSSRDTAEACAL